MALGGLRGALFLVFAASGFAGLIYESIWSHYLKLFLGHAAYAQTLVLAIFMGGMALGSWLCAKLSPRWRNLLLGYAVAEGVIGLLALVFHGVFDAATQWAYASIMPALGAPAAVNAFKWTLSALLILPQSVLLGMTFPLMSAGIIRSFPDRPGGTIAMLYFTNSLGAAAGVLVSGFVLIERVGLPGAILTAGVINVLLAIVVWALTKRLDPAPAAVPVAAVAAPAAGEGGSYRLMLAIALLTGAASFIYEIGWIRMLALVLGSSTHAFELMLSAFILGLACGGLWIRRRIDLIGNPLRFLGLVQVAMGTLAVLTLPLYGVTFDAMLWTLGALSKTDSGYALFNLSSHAIAIAVMFPATFCAGMTLPLITCILLKQGSGEKSIGAVYAFNTVGAIAGVFAAVHLGLPLLGLKGLMLSGALLDMALGLALLWRAAGRGARPLAAGAAALCAGVTLLVAAGVRLDPMNMAAGVYRLGTRLPQGSEVLFGRDGKTATVHVVSDGDVVSIRTNGKGDAAIRMRDPARPAPDEFTQALLAALPLAIRPEAKAAATIGFGSGMTSHTLLLAGSLERVDTIEIEPAMVEGARHFLPRVEKAYTDPRSRIHLDDARTFFSTHNRKYDIIVAEPSNPWVSGVSTLFSQEFYRQLRRHLNPGGLLVQWVQLYEIEPWLVASVMLALAPHYSDYAIFAADSGNVVILAQNGGALPRLAPELFRHPALAAELARLGIRNLADLELRRVGGRRVLQPLFESFRVPANSDYFPILDLNAARARFKLRNANEILNLANAVVPVLEMLEPLAADMAGATADGPESHHRRVELTRRARVAQAYLLAPGKPEPAGLGDELAGHLNLLRLVLRDCSSAARYPGWFGSVSALAQAINPFLPKGELERIWGLFDAPACAKGLNAREQSWVALWRAVGRRDARDMAARAEALLASVDEPDAGRRAYLLAAAMTGRLALGERAAAAGLWTAHGPGTGPDGQGLLLQLLRAHAFARGASAGPAARSGS